MGYAIEFMERLIKGFDNLQLVNDFRSSLTEDVCA
jgi:hypothetical protein